MVAILEVVDSKIKEYDRLDYIGAPSSRNM